MSDSPSIGYLIQHVYPRNSKLTAKRKSVTPESTSTVVLFALHLHFGEIYLDKSSYFTNEVLSSINYS